MNTEKRVLITGINGFTGKYVAKELESFGYQVYGTGLGVSEQPRYYQVDLIDKQRLASVVNHVRPSVVLHLAAVAFVAHGNANEFYMANVIGTRNLLEALSSSPNSIDSILLASSASVYGNVAEGAISEAMLPNPANDYAVSKFSMENMAKLWSNKLPIFIVRPFNYTGVGQATGFLIPKIIDHFQRLSPVIELGNLDIYREFNDVRVIADIYRRLFEVNPVGKTINVCSGATYSLRDVVSIAERISGNKIDITVNPKFVRENEVKTLCGDSSLLKSLIGDLKFITLEDTLMWMLQSGDQPR